MEGFTGRDQDHGLSPLSWFTPTKKWWTTEPFTDRGPHMRRGKARGNKVTKSAHFLAVKTIDLAEDYAKHYINEIVWFHGVPLSIIINRGPQFTSHFWKSFQKGLGTQVHLNTSFHPQTDGQAKLFEVGESALIRPDLVCEAMEKVQLIRDRLKTTQSR
ncbi:hypothetical protein MTR67_022664 [Solanum verrucosum]|uniref:Integrase catalytic domain-containing protein n=1 Tax=Solanum verrucosum TaxID=315347 RepID=A0AAF0QS64_SOLVR|nr:hypothetical protein MTR67_022664 [Solanum verrucosum]